jgi:hypothetical protein
LLDTRRPPSDQSVSRPSAALVTALTACSAAFNLFLARLTTTRAALVGSIQQQNSDADRATIGELFSLFLQGINTTLAVTGDSVITPAQPDRPVNWLSTAFRTLTLQVTLPGMVYKIIQSIKINDFELVLQDQSQNYAIDTSNQLTNTVFRKCAFAGR